MKTFLPPGAFSLFALLLSSAPTASGQSISIVSGNGQLICSQCPTRTFMFDPLVVAVKDARGNPMPNVTVTWRVDNPRGSDGRVTSATTVTGTDGTTSNQLFMSAPIMLLQTFLQTSVVASALGSSVTFMETNGAVSNGLAMILTSLQSPIPGTTLTGAPGSISSTPVRINVSSLSAGGPVPGVEVRAVSDPGLPATAGCAPTVFTDANGNAICNLQFGPLAGQGKIKIYVGGSYDIYGPFVIQVSGAPQSPPTPPTPVPTPPPNTPPPATGSGPLTATPNTVSFQYPGPVTQTVTVSTAGGSVPYSAAVVVAIARVDWLTVGTPTGPAVPGGQSTFPVTILPQGLAAGTYYGSVAIRPDSGGQDLIVSVQLIVGGGGGPPPTSPPVTPPPVAPTTITLAAQPSSVSFQYPGAVTQNVAISSSGGTVPYMPVVQAGNGRVDWLFLGQPTGPAAADGRSTFPIGIVPQGLAPGTYHATIVVHPSGGPDLTIPVDLVVAPAVVTAAPGNIQLSQVAGRGPFAGGSVNITSSGGATPFSASISGANWLAISPASGLTPAQVFLTVNPAGLAPGNYSATILITPAGAANGPLPITVTLTVTPSQSLRLSTGVLSFLSDFGAPAPPPQTLAATATDGTFGFRATATVISPPGGAWLSLSPATGLASGAPSFLLVSVNAGRLEPGTYTALITLTAPDAINSPQTVAVTYTITALAIPTPTLIGNAGSLQPGPVAPGEVITILGNNLGPDPGIETAVVDGFVQNLIDETQVTFDGIPAPLLYLSATRIKAIVPYAVAGQESTQLVILRRGTSSAGTTLAVAEAAPGIFADESGQAAVLNEDGSSNGPEHPAAKGSVIVILATGEGVTAPSGTDGMIVPEDATELPQPVLSVAVTIGGVAAEVQSAGAAPGMVSGMLQVRAVVPGEAPSGSAVPVVVTVGSTDSQGTANIAIE